MFVRVFGAATDGISVNLGVGEKLFKAPLQFKLNHEFPNSNPINILGYTLKCLRVLTTVNCPWYSGYIRAISK